MGIIINCRLILLLPILILFSHCGLREENPKVLFQEFLSNDALKHIHEFKGDGATVFPEFMSGGGV